MKDRNFNVAVYENSPEFIYHVAQYAGFVAICDADNDDALVALLNPIEQHKPARYASLSESARLLASAGQVYRAAQAMFAHLKNLESQGLDAFSDAAVEDIDAKWAMLTEYIEGDRPHAERGSRVDLTKFF